MPAEVASKKCLEPAISQKSSLVEADNENLPGLDTKSFQCIICFEKCKPMATLEVSVWASYTCHCTNRTCLIWTNQCWFICLMLVSKILS